MLYLQSPQSNSYNDFLQKSVSSLPLSTPEINVLIGDQLKESPVLNAVLSTLYTTLRGYASKHGFSHKLALNVLFNFENLPMSTKDVIFHAAGETLPAELAGFSLKKIDCVLEPTELPSSDSILPDSAPTVAVGGTFDHLHDGHKILLSMAAFCAEKKVIVGVTGPDLLKNKKYAQQIQSLFHRVSAVRDYLQSIIRPGQSLHIYQINDVCGPTGYVRDIDVLVISDETAKGADFVNNYRKEIGFHPLDILSVKVIGGDATAENNWEGKLSSTDLRRIEYEESQK